MLTREYMSMIIDRLGDPGDTAIARLFDATRQNVRLWRIGRTSFSPSSAIIAADILELDPAIVIADAMAERETNEAVKFQLERIADRFRADSTLPADAVKDCILCQIAAPPRGRVRWANRPAAWLPLAA